MIWSSETNLWKAFGSGDLWIAYAWPNDWVQMKKKKLKVVYMRPKEKPIAWVGMLMLLQGHAAPAARARLRRRLELDEVGERGSRTTTATATRTRRRVRRRATCCGAAANQPEGRHRAERLPRPRHPAAAVVREDVGAGEGLLTTGWSTEARRRAAPAGAPSAAARPDDAEPARPAAGAGSPSSSSCRSRSSALYSVDGYSLDPGDARGSRSRRGTTSSTARSTSSCSGSR